ncbi:DUF2231 domain-containing protein [candidate division KSB1 bacterium]
MKKYTYKELHNEKDENGNHILIAFDGKVYDISQSKMWKNGMHMNKHEAGIDLTKEIKAAPHDAVVMEKVKQVGIVEEVHIDIPEKVPRWLASFLTKFPYYKRHPHPASVHFSIAFTLLIPVFLFLYLFIGSLYFERASYYMLAASLIFTPPAIFSGLFVWWLGYDCKFNVLLKRKLILSILLFTVLIICFLLRFTNPDIMLMQSNIKIFYIVLCTGLPVMAGLIGHSGGKIVFPY